MLEARIAWWGRVFCHTWAIFQDQPDQRLGHDDLVQARDVGVDELAVVVDFSGKVRVVLVSRLEDDLRKEVSYLLLFQPQLPSGQRTLEPLVSL